MVRNYKEPNNKFAPLMKIKYDLKYSKGSNIKK